MNIMSVDVLSEIKVTVGGERCAIDLGTTTDIVRDLVSRPIPLFYVPQVLSCQPPQNLSALTTGSTRKREISINGMV